MTILKTNGVGKTMALKDTQILIPGSCKHVTFHGKGGLRMKKDLRWLISRPKQEDGR